MHSPSRRCCSAPCAITGARTGVSNRTRRPWPPTCTTTAHGWARRPPRHRPSACAVQSSNGCATPTPHASARSASGSAASKHVTKTEVTLRAPLGDPLLQPAAPTQNTLRRTPHEALLPDSLRRFRWSDPWVTVEGILGRDSVACRIESRDTLRQIVHRIPRRFLFIRWGTKALRQEIISSNPHTRIVYSEYIRIER